jgi:hypothetical protein
MKFRGYIAAVLLLLSAALELRGQEPPPIAGQRPDLGRPTRKDDPVPPFDYARYFPGKWTFEWRVPESPLGPAGIITGTEVITATPDGKFASVIEAEGPAGKFRVQTEVTYDAEARKLTRVEKDSRGFEARYAGDIGGDLGGFYTIRYESAPFALQGKQVRLKTTWRVVSPLNVKVQSWFSVDGGDYIAFGNPWWEKEFTPEKQ